MYLFWCSSRVVYPEVLYAGDPYACFHDIKENWPVREIKASWTLLLFVPAETIDQVIFPTFFRFVRTDRVRRYFRCSLRNWVLNFLDCFFDGSFLNHSFRCNLILGLISFSSEYTPRLFLRLRSEHFGSWFLQPLQSWKSLAPSPLSLWTWSLTRLFFLIFFVHNCDVSFSVQWHRSFPNQELDSLLSLGTQSCFFSCLLFFLALL